MMTVNLIDGSNIFFICYSIASSLKQKEDGKFLADEDASKVTDLFVMKIKQFLLEKNNIVCFEGMRSTQWRKKLYPEYKANRDKSGENMKAFPACIEACKEVLKFLPCKMLKVDGCEGDDCIYTISERIISDTDSNICIVSTDEDLTQIANFFPERVKVLHPIKKEYRDVNPDILRLKTFVGDSSDNIKFKKGLGPKTLLKMEESKDVFDKFVKQEDYDVLDRIHKIVDLRCFPLERRKWIAEAYNNTVFNEYNEEKVKDLVDNDKDMVWINRDMKYRDMYTVYDSYIRKLSIPNAVEDTSEVLSFWSA